MRVLDSSAFIHGYNPDGQLVSVPAVQDELKNAASYRFSAMEGGGMSVEIPGEQARSSVRSAASTTGDRSVLSETDISVLAVAYELNGILVTDDYAMQNVADELDIDIETVSQDGITEHRDWRYQCQGCGREFDESGNRCPVCGSDLKRKNPR